MSAPHSNVLDRLRRHIEQYLGKLFGVHWDKRVHDFKVLAGRPTCQAVFWGDVQFK